MTITGGTATQVVITPAPGSASASATTNIALGLQLEDQFGNNTTSTGTTTLTLSSASAKGFFATTNGASGTLGATANVTFTNGVGNVTEYYGDEKASASTLITAKNGAATWGTATVTINPGAAGLVVITPAPGSAGASATTNIALGLQLVDQFGNNTTSVGTTTLTLSSASAKGFFATTNGASGTLGATANVTFGPGVGTATEYYGDEKASASTLITAKNGAATWGTATVAITAQTSNDTMSIVQGNDQSATVNSAFGTALEVAIVDQFANPVPGVNVTFSAPATLASGTFAACSGGNPQTYQCVVATNAAGQATASTYTANTKSGGPYNVTTVAAGVAAPSTFSETNNPGTATLVFTTTTPGSASASATTNIALGLQLVDQFGNNTTSTGTTTLTLSSASAKGFFATTNGASGTLGATANVTFTNGVGNVTEYYGDEKASASTLITAKNGAATWGTATVAITGGTATQVVITPTPGSASASATTNIALGLQLEDQFGNNTTSAGTTTLTLSSASAKGFFATTNGASGTLGATANVTFSQRRRDRHRVLRGREGLGLHPHHGQERGGHLGHRDGGHHRPDEQ